MLLFVGLGNPGERYAGNRHNVGFMAVEAIARHHDIRRWRREVHGETAKGLLGGEQVVFLKPRTYMNDSGVAVGAEKQFSKIPSDNIVVFHDEIELPPGKVRVKTGGGNAGHNGLRSISAHVGNDYRRVRIGVGHPGFKDLVEGYVLSDFAKSERPWVEALCEIIAENAELLVRGQDATFQNKVHLAMDAKGFVEPKSAGKPAET
jgi:peptidyl-tRNA hydrolase, PTH1 family